MREYEENGLFLKDRFLTTNFGAPASAPVRLSPDAVNAWTRTLSGRSPMAGIGQAKSADVSIFKHWRLHIVSFKARIKRFESRKHTQSGWGKCQITCLRCSLEKLLLRRKEISSKFLIQKLRGIAFINARIGGDFQINTAIVVAVKVSQRGQDLDVALARIGIDVCGDAAPNKLNECGRGSSEPYRGFRRQIEFRPRWPTVHINIRPKP